jgi:hypothetical protein
VFDAGCDMAPVDLDAIVKFFFYDRTTVIMGDSLSHQHRKDLSCIIWSLKVPHPSTGVPTKAFDLLERGNLDLHTTIYRARKTDDPVFRDPTCYIRCGKFAANSEVLPEADFGHARVCFLPSGYHSAASTWSNRWLDVVEWLEPSDLIVMNFGLHWGPSEKQRMKRQLGPAADVWHSKEFQTTRYTRYPMIIWRETTPQHFTQTASSSAAGGYQGQAAQYEARQKLQETEAYKDLDPLMCGIMSRSTRNTPHEALDEMMREEFGIPVLYLYTKTASRHQNKAGQQARAWDCTHYCEPHSPEISLMTELLVDRLAIIAGDPSDPYHAQVSAEQAFLANNRTHSFL